MKAALVNDQNIVENLIVWDETCVVPDGVQVIVLEDDAPVSIGWKHQSGQFIDMTPAPPAPPQLTLAELQAQLNDLQAQIAAMTYSLIGVA
jgi:hypothetical protein